MNAVIGRDGGAVQEKLMCLVVLEQVHGDLPASLSCLLRDFG